MCEKSHLFTQKSPIYTQKSPIYTQKSNVRIHLLLHAARPHALTKVCVKRALCTLKQTHVYNQSALYAILRVARQHTLTKVCVKRAIDTLETAVCILKRAVYTLQFTLDTLFGAARQHP